MPIRSKHIELVAEDVQLDVLPHYTLGRVRYRLQNHGPSTTVTFGFPTLVFEGLYRGKASGAYLSYAIRVDGKVLKSTEKRGRRLSVREVKRLVYPNLKGHGGPNLRWRLPRNRRHRTFRGLNRTRRVYRLSRIPFARGQTRRLDITFSAPNYRQLTVGAWKYWRGSIYVSYLTRPARRWRGRIGKARFRVRIFGRSSSRGRKAGAVVFAPKPHRSKAGTYEWTYRNWLPTESLRVVVPFTTDRKYQEFWTAVRAGVDKLFGARIPASVVRRVLMTDRRGRKRRLKRRLKRWQTRKMRTPSGSRWMLLGRLLPRPYPGGAGPALTFELKTAHCIRGVALRQNFVRSQPLELELSTPTGFRQRLRFARDRHTSMGGSWAGIQVRLLRRPVRARSVTLTVRVASTRWDRLAIRRLGFIGAPQSACRLLKSSRKRHINPHVKSLAAGGRQGCEPHREERRANHRRTVGQYL